ncbi:hypothetical protein Q3G72_023448 [Acer saccharum]|nr:hypothetical protein Q3G72_023448 [Acer saccharum]
MPLPKALKLFFGSRVTRYQVTPRRTNSMLSGHLTRSYKFVLRVMGDPISGHPENKFQAFGRQPEIDERTVRRGLRRRQLNAAATRRLDGDDEGSS